MKHSKKRAFRRAGRDRRGGQWGDGFRDRLRTAMAKAGLNQNQLAQRLGCGSGQVTGWLSRGLPGADYLSKIARACDVSADWLLGFDVPMERSKDLPRRAGPAIKATEVEEYLRARATELLLAEVDARELRARRQGLKRLGPPQTGKLPVSPHGGPYFLTNLALAAITGVAEAAGRPDTD